MPTFPERYMYRRFFPPHYPELCLSILPLPDPNQCIRQLLLSSINRKKWCCIVLCKADAICGGNRSEVREAEGVKIYFDPVSTAAREESAKDLAAKVLADPAKKDCINTVISPHSWQSICEQRTVTTTLCCNDTVFSQIRPDMSGACLQAGTIVWHVAAHEIGHAIYGLDGALMHHILHSCSML